MKTRRSFLKAAAASLAATFALPFTLPAWLNPFKEKGLPSLHVMPGETVTLTEGGTFRNVRVEENGRLILDFDDPGDRLHCRGGELRIDGHIEMRIDEGDSARFTLGGGWTEDLIVEEHAPHYRKPGSLDASNWPARL